MQICIHSSSLKEKAKQEEKLHRQLSMHVKEEEFRSSKVRTTTAREELASSGAAKSLRRRLKYLNLYRHGGLDTCEGLARE